MTRPAMLWGVPLIALISSVSVIALIAAWTNFLVIFLMFPTIFVLREIAKKDDFIFDLYFLKLKTKGDLKTMRFWGANTFGATSYRKTSPKEQRLDIHGLPLSSQPDFSKFIPYSSHVAENVIITKEGDYVATWECSGIPFEIADDDDLERRKEQLNTLLRSFSHYSVSIYHHNVSRSVSEKLEGNFKSDYLKEINDLYYEGLNRSKFKRNTLYFTLVYRPYPSVVERRSRQKGSLEEKKQELNYHLAKMQEFCNRLEKGLSKFGGKALTTYEKDNVVYSQQLQFYNYLLTGLWQPIRITTEVFYKTLGNTLNHFGVDTGEIISPQGKRRFFRCIEIKDYVDSTYEGILDVLMYYSIDYTITHSFSLLGRNDAVKALKMQEKHLQSVEDDAETQLAEFSLAKDDLASGNLAFGKYHFSITVFGDTVQEATDNTNEC
nr:VirB3 family type IV secretion system protein [Rodentibacter rarus]